MTEITIYHVLFGGSIIVLIVAIIMWNKRHAAINTLEAKVLHHLGLSNWNTFYNDFTVRCKSGRAVDSYDTNKLFKENGYIANSALKRIAEKEAYIEKLSSFLHDNPYKTEKYYKEIERKANAQLDAMSPHKDEYVVYVSYTSPAGNSHRSKLLYVSKGAAQRILDDPTILMTDSQRNKHFKEQAKTELNNKQQEYYDKINNIIDYCNKIKPDIALVDDIPRLDGLIDALLNRTITLINKSKSADGNEWSVADTVIEEIDHEVKVIYDRNSRITSFYSSTEFLNIKEACEAVTNSKREFNEYIDEKVASITSLFGARVVREDTVTTSDRNFIRPYKKTVDAFTAEVSAAVFSSAENKPLEYVVKYFYPNKEKYPEQIQKLQTLIEELATLKDAKQIIENYKKEYDEYIQNVPDFIIEQDRDGFYRRLGFADLSENKLSVVYRFSYTSEGGLIQKSFTVPMTEATIEELINILQSKLTYQAFAKEQRRLMTEKLRTQIKTRDNYTCKFCGNSIHKEPNLLLEVDHIKPVAKGGITEENNLQTLCWKCNRQKSDKL